MTCFDLYESPCGRMLLVAEEEGLAGVYFDGQKYHPPLGPQWRRDPAHSVLRLAARELTEYFAGRRERFETPLAVRGTPFQRAIWKAISDVGFGETLSYGELARRAGFAGSARAAGAATGRNPVSVIVPCHRIAGASGSLTGYAGGLARKRMLLALESRRAAVTRRA